MSREKVEFDVIGRDSSGSKTFRQVGDAAERAGDQVEDLGKKSTAAGEQVEGLGDKARKSGDGADGAGQQYRGLAAEIEHTQGRIRSLAEEIDRTGNKDLFKDLRKQQSELRKLNSAKSLLPDLDMGGAGAQAAEKFSAQFVQRVGPLLARAPMGGPGAILGAVMAAAAVPTLAAAVAGAVVGGVGIGGVIGGVKLAAQDARVQAAGKTLGENMMGDLEDSATRFIEPTIAGVARIQDAWNDVSGDIDGALAAASRYVEPLAEGVGNFMRELAPGIRDAAEAAGPIIDVVSQELPEVGAVLSDMLSGFAENADEGASALRLVFMIIEDGISVVGGMINTFASWYSTMVSVADAAVTVAESLWGWIPGMGGQIEGARSKVDAMKGDLDRTGNAGGEAGTKIEGGLRKVDAAAATATVKVESLATAVRRMAGENISAEQASIRLEEAIDKATAAGAKNNDGIDKGTAKGRANRELLVQLASASNADADAILKQTNSQELASAATTRGRAAFLKAAEAMKVEKGEALRLADQLFGIPNVKRTVSVQEKQALDAISRVQAGLGRINDKNVHIGVYYTTRGDLKLPGGTQLKGLSAGGPVIGPGHKGVDSEPRMLAPGEYVLPARDVDRLGGFRGVDDLRRSLSGGKPYGSAPATTGGGGPDAASIGREVARALSGMTLVLDDRTGRTAALMARGV